MPRRKKSSKTVSVRQKKQQPATETVPNGTPKSDSGTALRQTVLDFHEGASNGLASDDTPVTPPSTPNRDVTPGSASPESIVSFVKEEDTSGVAPLPFTEDLTEKTTPKKKGRGKSKPTKPLSPMKRERAEETVEKPPSPMKRERATGEEEDTSPVKEEEEKVKQSSRDSKVRGTLDDYFGCSPREDTEAAKKGRGRVRRSKSAAAVPRWPQPELESFSLDRHFPIQRRSSRRDEKMMKEMTEKEIHRRVLNDIEEGMKIHEFEGKGRGIVATRRFERDEFVVEYAGRLVTDTEAKKLNAKYSQDEEVGCYMFWIMHRARKFCVDATAETGRFGRLVNHSRVGNLKPKVVEINDKPRLLLFAARPIFPGEELLYDYGDRDKQTLENFPWLKT